MTRFLCQKFGKSRERGKFLNSPILLHHIQIASETKILFETKKCLCIAFSIQLDPTLFHFLWIPLLSSTCYHFFVQSCHLIILVRDGCNQILGGLIGKNHGIALRANKCPRHRDTIFSSIPPATQ